MISPELLEAKADPQRLMAMSVAKALQAKARRLSFPSLPTSSWGRRFFESDYYTVADGKHHAVLDMELGLLSQKRGTRLVVAAPRGSAKSVTIPFTYVLKQICEHNETYILLIADTYPQAVKYLAALKTALCDNDLLASVYPDACGAGPVWNEAEIVTRNGIRIECLGSGQSIRGRRADENRPSLIVIDDPEDDEAAYSSVQRDHTRDWAVNGVFKAGAPTTNIIVIGTIIHSECLVAHCLGPDMPGWRKRIFKSIVQWPTHMQLWEEWEQILRDSTKEKPVEAAVAFFQERKAEMELGAEVLWEARESLYDLMFMRATEGHASFEHEKQNNPFDPTRSEWSPELFTGDVWFDEWPDDLEIKALYMDPKGLVRATNKQGDFNAIVMVGQRGETLYVEADLERRDDTQAVRDFIAHCISFRPDIAGIESVMFQHLLIREVTREIISQGLNAVEFPVVPVEDKANKQIRIRRLTPYLTMKRVRFKTKSPGTNLLIHQLQRFPDPGEHDDGPDAMEGCVRLLRQLGGYMTPDAQNFIGPDMGLPTVELGSEQEWLQGVTAQ